MLFFNVPSFVTAVLSSQPNWVGNLLFMAFILKLIFFYILFLFKINLFIFLLQNTPWLQLPLAPLHPVLPTPPSFLPLQTPLLLTFYTTVKPCCNYLIHIVCHDQLLSMITISFAFGIIYSAGSHWQITFGIQMAHHLIILKKFQYPKESRVLLTPNSPHSKFSGHFLVSDIVFPRMS